MSPNSSASAILQSDAELAADGDEVAFARLVARHHADMTRVAYVVTGDVALAQDAVQSAWEIAWRKLRSVRDPKRVRGWLLSITVNEARQILRRRRRISEIEMSPSLHAAERADPAFGIDRVDLVRALARFGPDDRALLALRHVVGLDANEIGALTGRSGSGTRARLSRLVARLREDLGDD